MRHLTSLTRTARRASSGAALGLTLAFAAALSGCAAESASEDDPNPALTRTDSDAGGDTGGDVGDDTGSSDAGGDSGDDTSQDAVRCDTPLTSSDAFPQPLAATLDARLAESAPDASAPGVVAAVVLPDGARWFGAWGVAESDSDVAIATHDRFRSGSITKTFAAAAVLQIRDEGRWSLEDPVDLWVPGFAFGPEVTLGRLLRHTAAVFNYSDDGSFLGQSQTDTPPEDVIAFALEREVAFGPGEGYLYSNTGFYLIGLALEAVEGVPFGEVIRARFLDPLGLAQTYVEGEEEEVCPLVQGHVLGVSDATTGFSPSWSWAAGALVSDSADLCVWGRALMRGDVVEGATLDAMLTPSPLSIEGGEPYGYGLQLRQRAGRAVAGHTGSTMGFNVELFIDLDTDACVVVQTNDFFGEPRGVSEAIWGEVAASLER